MYCRPYRPIRQFRYLHLPYTKNAERRAHKLQQQEQQQQPDEMTNFNRILQILPFDWLSCCTLSAIRVQ